MKTLIILPCSKSKAKRCKNPLQPIDFIDPNKLSDRTKEILTEQRDVECKAYQMYTGQFNIKFWTVYERLIKYCASKNITNDTDIYIHSAGYGLIKKDKMIIPYDVSYSREGFSMIKSQTQIQTRLEWGDKRKCRKTLDSIIPDYDLIIMFSNKHYLEALDLPNTPFEKQGQG